jgi:hypothetical protein
VKADAFATPSIDGFIDPKDIAQLAVCLASDATKSISGQVVPDRQGQAEGVNTLEERWFSKPLGEIRQAIGIA